MNECRIQLYIRCFTFVISSILQVIPCPSLHSQYFRSSGSSLLPLSRAHFAQSLLLPQLITSSQHLLSVTLLFHSVNMATTNINTASLLQSNNSQSFSQSLRYWHLPPLCILQSATKLGRHTICILLYGSCQRSSINVTITLGHSLIRSISSVER